MTAFERQGGKISFNGKRVEALTKKEQEKYNWRKEQKEMIVESILIALATAPVIIGLLTLLNVVKW